MEGIEIKSVTKVFGGLLTRFTHQSKHTKTPMTCAVYIPPAAAAAPAPAAWPTLIYLSGLTCTDENVSQKSGVFKYLAEHGLAFIAPDTSPRGAGLAGETDSWDFGVGAGFYLDATQAPWSGYYKMYSYIVDELLQVIVQAKFPIDLARIGITGHSMGGHGALTIAFKNPTMFKSVSAFAPISNPINCPWGIKAFTGYLGEDKTAWAEYDATELLKSRAAAAPLPFDDILIDVGTADGFYKNGQLLPENFQAAAATVNQPVTVRMQDGYDHSYFFIASFMEDHVKFHAQRLL